jgi:hypothetical protein
MAIRSLLATSLLVLAGACGAAQSPPVAAQSAFYASATVPSGFTLQRTGGVHDFDYLAGAWTTAQRKLRGRGVASTDWEEFPANLCVSAYLGGAANVDELWMPTKQAAGITLRAFDPKARQWAIYWVSSTTGRMEPPVIGGFAGDRGEFYANDQWEGRPVRVRFIWRNLDPDHASWEQAFSFDNATWETNWTAKFTRADKAALCADGPPRR